jgi:predicted amidohydrolase YtcJ
MVKIGFVKVLADGSLGGHTAALYEPYSDRPDTGGMMLYTQRKLNKIVCDAHRAGLQIALHAIGDRAMNAALSAYERVFNTFPKKDHRHRIEHCSVLNPILIKRMRSLGIIASVQPHFVFSDFWVAKRVGEERARWVYPFKSLIDEGIAIAAGSDCPVEPIDPLLGMWAAVARRDSHEENVTAEEALRMYTSNAAYASFEEKRKGSIEAGKSADFTVLSDDPRAVPPEQIKDIKVDMVIVDGRVVYER